MILSLDISTTTIGYALFGDDEKLKELNYVTFKRKLDLFEKLEEFEKKIYYLYELPIDRIVIEEPLKKMSGSFSNADTISKLNFFNGMVSASISKTFGVKPVHVNVNSVRSVVFEHLVESELMDKKAKPKKGETKQFVWEGAVKLEPQVNWIYNRNGKLKQENFDMADAYFVGKSDILISKKQKAALEQ